MFIEGVIKKEQLGFDTLYEYVEYIKKENAGAFFLPMLVAGLPNVPACAEMIVQLESNGAKMIELFVPTQDAFLEDTSIKKAMDHALSNNFYLSDCFDLVSLVRQRGCRIPIILRSYFSSVFNYGLAKFIKKCHLSGINVLNIQNLPMAKLYEISPYLRRNKVEFTCSLGKKHNENHILALNNPANNISMIYKNVLVVNNDNPTSLVKSVIDDQVIKEIQHLKEETTKGISVCGSLHITDDDNIKNLASIIDEIDVFSFKSCLPTLQYMQTSELENFQDKVLYEQNNIIINRVVEKAKKYINVKKLLDDYAKKDLNPIAEDTHIDIDNLLDNEVTIDVIDLKTKEEREQELKALQTQEDEEINDDTDQENLEPTKEEHVDEIAKTDQNNQNVDNTILVDNKPKDKEQQQQPSSSGVKEPTTILTTGEKPHE